MNESERLEILELLASQKITAQEAADMLRPAEAGGGAEPSPKVKVTPDTDEPVYKAESADGSDDELEAKVIPWSNDDPWSDDDYKMSEGKPRWLRIRVRDMGSERNKVTVNVPLWLVSFGLGAARRFGADMGGVDPEMVSQMINEGRRGVLVDVQDEEDGEHVQIYLD